MRKYAEEHTPKIQKMTVSHFGFMEKVHRLPFSTTPQQHNTSFAEGGLPLLSIYLYTHLFPQHEVMRRAKNENNIGAAPKRLACLLAAAKRLVFQRKPLVGDFCMRILGDATQPDKLIQQDIYYNCLLTIVCYASKEFLTYTHIE